MAKIYIVKSSSGYYEDYRSWNEKAFNKKEDAEAYAKKLDEQHYFKPHFITEEFENLLDECGELLPEWEDCPYYPVTDENMDAYYKWVEEQNAKELQTLIDLMYKRGQFMTESMYNQYNQWCDNKFADWHDCTVEELELE